MKSIIITGEDVIIDIIAKENRIRVLRGKLTIENFNSEKKVELPKPEKVFQKPAPKPASKPVAKPANKPTGKSIVKPIPVKQEVIKDPNKEA